MRQVRSLRKGAIAVVAAFVLALATAAVGYAQDNGIIRACVLHGVGQLRVVTGGEPCHENETELVWNQVGPAGARGPQGPQGPQGLQGPAGEAGAAGRDGVLGYEVRQDSSNGNLRFKTLTVWCPSGKLAVSGGATTAAAVVNTSVLRASAPAMKNGEWTGWTASAYWPMSDGSTSMTTSHSWTLTVHVVCATTPSD